MSSYVCPECGLDYDTVSPSDGKVAIASMPRRYRGALAAAIEDDADEGLIRRRPDATTWSALEYTAHVADLYELFTSVITRMNTQDHPKIDDFWDSDERAAAERYNEMEPSTVLSRLEAGAASLDKALERVDSGSWGRTATFAWGDRDILTMMRNAVHEGSHHLRDVERVLEAARQR
jgi:hypothetical protein